MNFIEKIKLSRVKIDDRYAIRVSQMEEIVRDSDGAYDVVSNAFTYGYMQGIKAERNGKDKVRKEINNIVNKLSDEELGRGRSLINRNRFGIISEQKDISTPIWAYKGEILRLLRVIWKLDDVKLFQIIYTNIKVYVKHRGIEV